MLLTEWDTHDCNTKYKSHYRMCQGHLDTTKHNPQDIEEHRPAAHLPIPVSHHTTEWEKRKTSHLEQLNAYGDTYDSNAISDSQNKIGGSHEKTTKTAVALKLFPFATVSLEKSSFEMTV